MRTPLWLRCIAAETVALLVNDYKTTGGMNECYNPDTGKPTDPTAIPE